MVSELGGAQMSTLLESLPGIANVLRSPVADALVGVIRAAARLEEFELSDAEELVQYASRRGLLDEDEGVRILKEVEAAYQKRASRAADRAKQAKAKAKGPARKKAKKPAAKKARATKPAARKSATKKPAARKSPTSKGAKAKKKTRKK
ncbi:MAG: hypothetical protein HKM89_11600 [Gemmatimonadales bacterium]|nr:hypothetical protein [Gemmatimonadales bacterium]